MGENVFIRIPRISGGFQENRLRIVPWGTYLFGYNDGTKIYKIREEDEEIAEECPRFQGENV